MFKRSQPVASKCEQDDSGCGKCETPDAHDDACIDGACEDVLASIQDRRDNGGTAKTVRDKAFHLIELLFEDLEKPA